MSFDVRAARDAPSTRRKRLGVFIDWLADGYSDIVLEQVDRAVASHDLDVVSFVAGLDVEDYPVPHRHLPIAYASRDNIDAVLVVSAGNNLAAGQIASYFRRFEPLPIASVSVQWAEYPTVEIDNASGVREGVAHLIQVHGRRRFACIQGPLLSAEARDRFRAFRETLDAHSIEFDPQLLASGMYIKPHGVQAVRLWLDERKLSFDAVVAANDSMALGALEELTRRGLSVPRDVSLFGFDDIDQARCSSPPLTTVRQPFAAHVTKAVELVLRQLAGQEVPRVSRIGSELVIRRSCGCDIVTRDSHGPPARGSRSPNPRGAQVALLAALGDASTAQTPDPALVDAFDAAVSGGPGESFLRRLEALAEQRTEPADLSTAFRVLGELHRYADRVDEAGARAHGRLFDDVAAILAQTAERVQVAYRYRAEERILNLIRANEALTAATDYRGVQAVLGQTLRQFGIPRCFVCLLEGDEVPAQWARLVVACDPSRTLELPADGIRFPARDLVPGDLLSADDRTSWFVCPLLRHERRIPGYVVLQRTIADAYLYDGLLDQIGGAYKRVELLARIVQEVRLRELAERERIEKEMQIAAGIQTGILPRSPRVEGLEFSSAMHSATEVGGDYYDVLPVHDGSWVGIGDVAGHGLPTGLVMLMLQSAVSSLVRRSPDASPRELLGVLNEVLFDNIRHRMNQDEHVTLTLIRHHRDGRLAFAGSHEDLLVYRAREKTVERIATNGVWVGVLPEILTMTEEHTTVLGDDDVLLLYTDGITEALDARNEMYGIDRLAEALQRLHAEPLDAIRDTILDEVRAWAAVQRDDMTLVLARKSPR